MRLDSFRSTLKEKRLFLILYTLLFVVYFICNVDKEVLNINSFKAELIILFLVYVGGIICISYSSLKLHNLAFLMFIIFGSISLFITPILDIPDETTHFTRAEITSRGNFKPKEFSGIDYEANKEVLSLCEDTTKTVLDSQIAWEDITNEVGLTGSVAAAYPFWAYVIPSIGILIAKIFNMKVIWMLWLARLGNLILSAYIYRLAIKIAPKFKMHLFVVSTLPMLLYLSASSSMDAIVNCFSILIVAYFIKLYFSEDNSIGIKESILFGLVCLVPSMTKFVYLAFVLLFFLVPKEKFKLKKTLVIKTIVFLVLSVITIAWYFRSFTFPKVVIVEGNDLFDQIKYILNNKTAFISILLNYLGNDAPQLFSGLFCFGWLSYSLPSLVPIYLVYYGSLTLLYPIEEKIGALTRFAIGLVCLIIYLGVGIIMYLSWAPVGADAFYGVQSRYFISLLALLPMILNYDVLRFNEEKREKLDSCIKTMSIAFIAFMLISTCIHYY